MPKRTAADFAREASTDGDWTYALKDGRELRPRARSQFTFDEGLAEAQLAMDWAMRADALQAGREDPGKPELPFHFDLKIRLSEPNVYIEARDAGNADEVELPDYDAFWTEVKGWPLEQVRALITDLDEFYPPTEPGSDQEKRDAAENPVGDAAGKSGGAATS